MPNLGPVRLRVAGDTFTKPCRIGVIVWEGAANAGDTAELNDPVTGVRLWRGRSNDVNNYIGVNFAPLGEHCPNGFTLSQISSGDVLVYLNEN